MRVSRFESDQLYEDDYERLKERGEQIPYPGDGRDYRRPNVPTFPRPYVSDSNRSGSLAGFRYGDRIDEDISEYGSIKKDNVQNIRGLGALGDRHTRYAFDSNQSGHKGKGPKSYKRSDERILEDICNRLTDNRHLDASEIEVLVEDGNVILKGAVERRYEKRLAEDLGDAAYDVKNIENRLRIKAR